MIYIYVYVYVCLYTGALQTLQGLDRLLWGLLSSSNNPNNANNSNNHLDNPNWLLQHPLMQSGAVSAADININLPGNSGQRIRLKGNPNNPVLTLY